MITVQTEIAEKVACICCGAEKYATQSPYLCHNCWKNGEAAKLIQQLTQRALDGGDSAALQALSTPEVLSTLQGESNPAHRK